MDIKHMELLQSVSEICFVIAAAALVLALVLFFFFDIRNVFLIEIGRAKSRAVQEMETRNQSAEKLGDRAGKYRDNSGRRGDVSGKARDDSGERRDVSGETRDDSGEYRGDSERSCRNTVRLNSAPQVCAEKLRHVEKGG